MVRAGSILNVQLRESTPVKSQNYESRHKILQKGKTRVIVVPYCKNYTTLNVY